MEDLQSTLQSILSDPEQMGRIAAMAESLGLKPPDAEAGGRQSEQEGTAHTGAAGPRPEAVPPEMGAELVQLLGQLGAMSGSEDRILAALRPSLSAEGQRNIDRALRAAKLSRLASRFLRRRGEGHV